MSFRVKLLLLLIGLVMATGALLSAAYYRRCHAMIETEIHRKARSIASTTAALLDPEVVRAASRREDEHQPEYLKLEGQLRRIRDFNRRKDVWIQDIFTLTAAPQNPAYVAYGADAEDRFAYQHHPGDIYHRDGAPVTIGLSGINQLAERLSAFQAGYKAAFAPIRDKNGTLIAMVGVELIPAPNSVINDVGTAMIAPLIVTIGLAVIIALFMGRAITRPVGFLRAKIEQIGNGDFEEAAKPIPGISGELATVAASITAMANGLRERETIKRAFSGYISRQVLETIIEKGELSALKGERRRITVLFSDIRGFTSIAEGMSPEEVVQMLSEFFDRMVEVVMRHKGTIDKFLGDGMMVIFGAPVDDVYQEEHAVMAALEMQKEMRALSQGWEEKGRRALKMGIGINSGNAVVGNIGSEEHMEYTAIGDTVNLASRLEAVTKELGVDVIVSEYTYEAVRPLFQWKPAGTVEIRGRSEAVRAFTLEDGSPRETAA
ncbi:MAG TPA: adenylate/guanylate cyclase domain-containing protein [Candidatus Binataceae bacterium]|nr:adenylate/guanylate cyclase domain-containing protein [Candidatus Binataceae bacterium]